MLDPAKSQLLEKVGSIVALWVLALETICIVLPYVAAHYAVDLNDQDRAMLSQAQTTVQNVFIAVVSFFFGASVGTRQQNDTINRMSTTADRVQSALAPIVAAVVPAAPGPNNDPPPPHNGNGVPQNDNGTVVLQPGEQVNVSADK